MGSNGRGGTAPAELLLADSGADELTRRSISRQVRSVVICTLLLVAVFIGATANAVVTIDRQSSAADISRAEAGVRTALAEGRRASNTLVRQIARELDLQDARLARPESIADGETAIPLTDGYVMAFAPHMLGTETFQNIAPIRVSIAVVLALFIMLVLNRLHSLARVMDAQRLAARRLATLDPLTGLSNRLHFNEQLARQLDSAGAGADGAALVLLDLDGFKSVNDRWGHVAGDRLLQQVAQRLLTLATPADIVARLGGDEFAIIRNAATTRHELTAFAEVLASAVSAPFRIDGGNLAVGVSIGIARIAPETRDAASLIRAADVALYRAKARPGGSYEFAAHTMPRPVAVPEPAAAA
jgi:diguanylate cyclase (GGDEF)-like protein